MSLHRFSYYAVVILSRVIAGAMLVLVYALIAHGVIGG